MLRNTSIAVLAVFFIVAGANHFLAPTMYLPLMPDYLPWHLPLIYLSGVAEMLGGIGICFTKTRQLAGWLLIAVLLAVFPANIHMLKHNIPVLGGNVPTWVLWLRLPLQFLMIAWIDLTCIGRIMKHRASDHG